MLDSRCSQKILGGPAVTASMLALTSAAVVFVVLLLAVAWLLWRGHDVPIWLTCVVTLLLAAFTLVCVVLLMLPLLRLLEMAVMMWTLVFA